MPGFLTDAVWSLAAGALIPVMAILNAGLGRSLGGAPYAVVILFAVGLIGSTLVAVLARGALPAWDIVTASPPRHYLGGLIVAFYVLSVTMLVPRFGVGNVILFAMTAQIVSSAAIDHFGLFGASVRSLTPMRLIGLFVLMTGLVITQLSAGRTET